MNTNKTILHPKIITLGQFDLRDGEMSLLGSSTKRSYRIFDLLKLFIAFKDKKMLPETIMEKLWPDSDLQDPKNALRTQIYRLRKMLTEIGFIEGEGSDGGFCQLIFQNGFYVFSIHNSCRLDVEEFEGYIQEGNMLKDSAPSQAIACYQKAFRIYKGEFLAENLFSEWLIPLRNRYHRLYFRALLQHLELLKNGEDYAGIIETCEEGFQIDPYEESVHAFYLEALIKIGQIKQATSHYKYITARLYQELGVKPSPILREIYREIKQKAMSKSDMNFWDILRDLKDEESMETAFYCEADEFRAIYNLESRKSYRFPSSSFLGLISLTRDEGQREPREIKNSLQKVKSILLLSLRKGDAITQWNDSTLMFIVTSASEENLTYISRRIENNFSHSEDSFSLNITFQAIGEKKEFLPPGVHNDNAR